MIQHDGFEPAFPVPEGTLPGFDGATLWDLYAMHALGALLPQLGGYESFATLAADAAKATDAMIAERLKRV